MIGEDRILFASDYPHWEFDAPHAAFKSIPRDLKEKILYKNAMKVYGLPDPTK
ncbi:amidohydrolase family protein [Neobacillus vireti]